MKKKKDWFKIKGYPHIGLPLEFKDKSKWIVPYITNPKNIATHAFLPFIHNPSRVKKFRKEYSTEDGKAILSESNKALRNSGEKQRDIFYASHLDSLIFSYYAEKLSDCYEAKIKSGEYQLSDVVNAYRSIPVNPSKPGGSNKCNIDFANDIFKSIIEYGEKEFVVIAFDITSYFDNLNHAQLRKIWGDVIGSEKLPPDHFNVYKNITRFSYVDIVDIFEMFKDNIITRKKNKAGQPLEIKKRAVKKIKFLRNQDAIAFCEKEEFLKVKHKLIKPNKCKKLKDGTKIKRDFGIPQGSPISSVLANMYLLYFDKVINDFLVQQGGIYRRYSDDIVIVCPKQSKEAVVDLVYSEIKENQLEIQPSKTQIFHFKRESTRMNCGQEFESEINWNKNFTYLGFEFDGEHVLLKSGSLSRYYRKMKRYVRRSKYHANKPYNRNNGIFKRRIYKKFSYKGAKRTRRWRWNEQLKMYEPTNHYNYGNFMTYAKKASKQMVNNKIDSQIKRHWAVLNRLIHSYTKE